jgi:ADP-ribose pyrophosphatase YjhB (NUDIX family)
MKENFEITAVDGKKYWISRAHAVVACVVGIEKTETGRNLYFLLERRGPGCPDNVGKLAFPCGYVNWDETRADAVVRETYEEVGLRIELEHVVEWETIDDPNADARQNIVTRYIVPFPFEDLRAEMPELIQKFHNSEARGGEAMEVSELILLSEDEVLGLTEEEFAFNHKGVIEDLISYLDEEYVDMILDL